MPRFLSEDISELTRQLVFAPPSRRRRLMQSVEDLYWHIEPQQNYPLDFLVYRITGYRPETSGDVVLTGSAVRADLTAVVEQLSESLHEKATDHTPRPLDQKALCKRLNVSSKTVSRYRRDGLFARIIDFGDGRPRLGFLPASVDRFLERRGKSMERAARFSRLDEPTRHAIIMRARRIAARVETTPFAVARHLSRKFGRSTEAVRQLLLAHDKADSRVAIFPEHAPPLTEKQQRIIHRAYHRGVPVALMAERYRKARNAVYRAINRRRTIALRQLPIRHVHSPTFDLPDAEQVILESDLPPPEVPTNGSKNRDSLRPLYDTPLLSPAAERAMFARYNFLKYRAGQLRDQLDKYQPRSSDLDRIETLLRWAVNLKHHLVRANLRLVVSVARKHLGSRFSPEAMSELIGEGNIVLLEAIDTFDAGRGNRFSTYLTWALMRHFATAGAVGAHVDQGRPATPMLEYWPASLNPNVAAMEHAEHVAATLSQLLIQLDARERLIISRHFGLSDEEGRRGEPQTLAQVAQELNISAERARQIEHRALLKLRDHARDLGLTLPASAEQ